MSDTLASPVPGSPPAPPEASAPRLVATLAVAGAIAGLLIVLVFQWAQPRIEANQAAVLDGAIREVLQGPERYDRYFVQEGELLEALPSGADTMRAERVFLGYDSNGSAVGFAILGGEPGFQDVIRLIFGYDPVRERVLGMKVLDSKETPGLGDKIEKDSTFVRGFRGVTAPLVGVKPGARGQDPREVEMITGATISARAIVNIINNRIAALHPVLSRHPAGAVR